MSTCSNSKLMTSNHVHLVGTLRQFYERSANKPLEFHHTLIENGPEALEIHSIKNKQLRYYDNENTVMIV